jgi:hypothetical protein
MSITYKNSFNAGDLVTMLPGMQKLHMETGKKSVIYQRLNMVAYYYDDAKHPVKNSNGVQVCMNKKVFDMMKPLLEAQPYIEEYRVWKGEEVMFDFDLTRHSSQIPIPGGDIHSWVFLIFPQLSCDLSVPWINKKPPFVFDKIIINRTARYNNPYVDYFFIKKHEDKVMFAGTSMEHKKFCSDFELNIPLLKVNNFLELAQAISSCRFFIGNQSMCWHIADAMKHPRILEVCSAYPNSFPTGGLGEVFVTQPGLDYYFNKFLKETE